MVEGTCRWLVILEGTTKDLAMQELTFKMVDHKEFTLTPIAVTEDWLASVLAIAAKTEKYRVKNVLKTVRGPQQENIKDWRTLFIYAFLKKNAIPLTFLLGALKEGGFIVMAIWPPPFVKIVRQNPEKELVQSILIQIAKNPRLFEFVNICYSGTQELPYAS